MESTTVIRKCQASEVGRGLKDSVAVAVGFLPFALVLGGQAVGKGLTVFEVPLPTGLNFGGGSEFAAIGLWTSPPQLALLVGVTLLVNSRHLLMGATLAPYLRGLPKKLALPCLFLMCDESWALSLADAQRRRKDNASNELSLGSSMGDITRYGFDMAFPAVFFVLLRGMWKRSQLAP